MLNDYYSATGEWQVVVLDFDLSWHRGSVERSVVHGSTLLGYLAPEQIQPIQGVSTRHAAVDSFGLGMLLFFLISGHNPLPDEHRHGNWIELVRSAAERKPCDT
jgi:serine/threonine protein kinase